MGSSTRRIAAVGAIAALASVVALAFGGLGLAKSKPTVAQYGYGKGRVVICHKGRILVIGRPGVAAHLRHGDRIKKCVIVKRKHAHRGHKRIIKPKHHRSVKVVVVKKRGDHGGREHRGGKHGSKHGSGKHGFKQESGKHGSKHGGRR